MATGLQSITSLIVRVVATALLWSLALGASAQTVRYIHTDALGSVAVVTDQNRNVIERREYEPYGLQLTPAIKDGPGYTGHVQDAATGLTYMQQRYYDPLLGLFLSVDPVTAYSSPMASFHRYRYANNSPYRFTDPDGRDGADRRYGQMVGWMLRNDPEKLRIWAAGEAAATTQGSLAEQGAAEAIAVSTFFETGDYSGPAVASVAASILVARLTHGKGRLPHMRVQDVTRKGAAERNYQINWTQKQFEQHLKDNNYSSQTSKDGKVTNWVDADGKKAFTTRDFSTSTNSPTAEMHVNGEVAVKIRFERDK